jgi:hypothetical protein
MQIIQKDNLRSQIKIDSGWKPENWKDGASGLMRRGLGGKPDSKNQVLVVFNIGFGLTSCIQALQYSSSGVNDFAHAG